MHEPTVINIVPINVKIKLTAARAENLPIFLMIRPNPSQAAVQKLSPLRAI